MTDTGASDFEFDVALSYAGEDRDYVGEVAELLRDSGVRVFYDEFVTAEAWGADLPSFFDDVFRKEARFAVLFISRHYVTKAWPNLERKSAQARALVQTSPYVLPVRFDDSELPGLVPTVGHVDARVTGPTDLASLIMEKLKMTPKAKVEATAQLLGVPQTPDDESRLVAERPAAWEYLLLAGVILQGTRSLETKWYDHQLRHRATGGAIVESLQDGGGFLKGVAADAVLIVQNTNLLVAAETQEKAFGAPGEPGDPALIRHIGHRWVGMYEDLLDLAARVRDAKPPDEMEHVFDLASHFMDRPLGELREFFDSLISQFGELPKWAADPDREPRELTLSLVLTMDDALVAEFTAELAGLSPSI